MKIVSRLLKLIGRPIINCLNKPAVRHKYLPKIQELVQYSRKEAMLSACLEYVHWAEVKGDYLEFGMWKGGSMIAAYHLSKRFGSLSDMKFYGFDSFQGIPTLNVNKSEAKAFPPGIFSAGLLEVRNNLVHADVDMSRVELIPGWYSDTLNHETEEKLGLRAAAIVNVDCDVYESTVPVLTFVEPYLVDGSIVIFDDWYCFANREELGEQKAFKEWLERNGQLRATPYKEYGWDGKAFIINRLSAEESDGKDIVMTRTIDGKINFWNYGAERLYGWRKEEALGKVSHNLLRTEFPEPLERIDTILLQNGKWEGKLVHAARDGSRIVVESRWVLDDPKAYSGKVVEINTPLNE
jgi:O-methyltransferase